MSDVFAGQGSCLCGAVGFSAENAAKNLGACHCGMCRKWGGGPAMMVPCADAVSFSGDENIGVFASSEWAERGFRTSCGSHLFYRVRKTANTISPPVSSMTKISSHSPNRSALNKSPHSMH